MYQIQRYNCHVFFTSCECEGVSVTYIPACFQVYWSDSGELCAICTDDTIYLLKYNPEKVTEAMENKDEISEDGIEEAFDVRLDNL